MIHISSLIMPLPNNFDELSQTSSSWGYPTHTSGPISKTSACMLTYRPIQENESTEYCQRRIEPAEPVLILFRRYIISSHSYRLCNQSSDWQSTKTAAARGRRQTSGRSRQALAIHIHSSLHFRLLSFAVAYAQTYHPSSSVLVTRREEALEGGRTATAA